MGLPGAGATVRVLALGGFLSCVAPPGSGRDDAGSQEVDPSSLPPSVVTSQLADAVTGVPYGDRLLARDGVPPYAWAPAGLPPGWLSVDSATGELRGLPRGDAGTLSVGVVVTDAAARSGSKELALRLLSCTPGSTLVCQQASGTTCLVGLLACQPNGTWSDCDAGTPSASASGCGAACAACGPDADRCLPGGAECACGPSSGPCAPGRSCCADSAGGARCVDLAGDPLACGACGTRCAAPPNADPTCDTGVCGATCKGGYAACDGRTLDGCEVDLRSDVNHCGACPVSCSGSPRGAATCDGGTCDLQCNASYPQHCGTGDCRAYDVANCGGCGVACSNPGANAGAPAGCAGQNACSYACNPGWGDCNAGTDGCETDLTFTPTRCGSCGNDCVAAGWDGGCVNGQCARCYQCPDNPSGGMRTTCCGGHCQLNIADQIYDCQPCGTLIDGGC